MMMNGRSSSSKYPFTPTQWQELEHQALIFKYMASGISIPPDLLFTIKRSILDSPLSSRLLPQHPQHFGWNYLQMGLGRKIDPEPGRCRRTDGKKWRCSKEAYPDSKYCERHMHRGKNRSRKPVEVFKSTPITNTNTNTNYSSTPTSIPSSFITKNINSSSAALITSSTTHSLSFLSSSSVSSDSYHHHHHHPQHSSPYGSHLKHHPFLYNHQPSRSSAIGLSFENNSATAPIFLDPSACSRNRYVYGPKEEVDEHAFFTEPSGTIRSFSTSSMDDSWKLKPLAMSSPSSSKQRSCNGLSNDNSYLQLQSLSGHTKQLENQDQGFYNILGSSGDIKCEETTLMMKLGKQEPHKTVHRFFDEWPHKSRGSWLDLDEKSSTTQLSISIPTSAHDFPSFNSRTHNAG